ncbi:MAG: hypothetical protein PUG26_05980 [Oscillospiraceae bacterium]|nr:hypothetical protein [Oscillospiraceae bacterium]
MKCENCGGALKLVNGAYECEHCHSRYAKDPLYENTEVAIRYVEADDFGRRTKDSLIAQNVYSRLEALNINTFYQHASVEDLSGEEMERACTSATDSAKILIILAGSEEHFSKLLSQNKELLSKKKIIPIYFDMNAYDIPSEISAYQAVNLDNVGAIEDLAKNILILLGRNNEADDLKANKKAFSKKKKITLITCITLITILMCTAIYIVFGTVYVLPSKKYDKAEQLISEQKYVDAIDILDALKDYKNSQNLLKNIYAQYDGYYLDNKSGVGLHINITGASRADVAITIVTSKNTVVKITESAAISKNAIHFEYNDSQNNQGTVNIILKNDGIDLTVSSNNEKNIFFALAEKSDQPITKEIDRKTLLNWLETKISMSQIKALGYEIEEYSLMERDGLNRLYQIKNTDIILAMFGLDISEGADRGEGKELSDKILFGIMAPADIICPDCVGKEYEPFIENDVLYWPGADVGEGPIGLDMGVYSESKESKITSNTQIGLASKNILTPENWESIMNEILKEKVESYGDEYYALSADNGGSATYLAESKTHMLFAFDASYLDDRDSYALFNINRTTRDVTFVGEVQHTFDDAENSDWQLYYPELESEFTINRYD